MRALELGITAVAYEISVSGQVLARLDGGPSALLAGAGERLRDVDLEAAIERAENWLMPSSRSFQGLTMHVRNTPVRLRNGFAAAASLTPQEVERAFSGLVDDVAFHRAVDRDFVADLVLLRELVHHGALSGVVLE